LEFLEKIKDFFVGLALNFADSFRQNFIEDNRWKYLVNGLGTTLTITIGALALGVVLGFLLALVRTTHDKTGKMRFLNGVAKLYLTVIRGTPVVVQLMIMFFVVFASVRINQVIVAVIAFGINSGAYVAEIFRSGIMSIDAGQMEAGRSLGLTYNQTMWRIIMPQAVKNVLPALGNEMITLLKETSVAGYIALQDLTKAGDIIRNRTYSPFLPLLAVAAIYLVLVLILQALVGRLERRLAKSDRN
jgi:His/Glu/Gln/Arg/opine family amino acid ABC transporter permease subunit